MPKPAGKMTQRALEALRRELLPDCARLESMRFQIDGADRVVRDISQWETFSDEEKTGWGFWHRQDMERWIAEGEKAKKQSLMAELAPRARELAQSLTDRAEPAWQHLAVHDDASWAKFAEVRPKVLRGEGSAVLCRLAAVVTTSDRVVIGKWVINWLTQARKDQRLHRNWHKNPLDGLNATAFSLMARYLQSTDTQAGPLLERVGFDRLLTQAKQWRETEQVRAALANAGTPIGQVDAGELRLMNAEDLGPLGEYLHCCIGSAGYPQHARAHTKAFVCVYDSDLPVCAIEITPQKNGSLELGQTQGMMNRYWEHRAQIDMWLARPETRGELAAALGYTAEEKTITVKAPTHGWYYDRWRQSVPLWSSASVQWDLSPAVTRILSAPHFETRIIDSARDGAGKDVAEKLAAQVKQARERSDSQEQRDFVAKQAAHAAKREELDRLLVQYHQMERELVELQNVIADGAPAFDEDEAQRLALAVA